MKRFLILMAILSLFVTASTAQSQKATTFTADGINYKVVNDSSVAVTYAKYEMVSYGMGHFFGYYTNNYQGDIVIPSKVHYNDKEYTVRYITDHAFCTSTYRIVYLETACETYEMPVIYGFGGSPIISVYIPSTVVSIGERAFYECSSLTKVRFEDESNIPSIGTLAFTGTAWLENQEIDPFILDGKMFSWRGTVDTIPQNVTHILSGACRNLPLKTVRIPESVRRIGKYAFENSELESLIIDENDKDCHLEANAFKDCKSLKRVEVNAKHCSVGIELNVKNEAPDWNGAFTGCSLDSVIFDDSLQTISPICYNQYDMTEITIPENVKLIEHDAFALTDLTTHSGKGIKKLNYNAISCDFDYDEMCGIVMEERAIVFSNLRLEQVIIGEEVRKIPENFLRQDWTSHSHPLKKITIPAKVDTIGAYAFNNCVKLESITSLRPEPVEVEPSVFEGVNKQTCVLYVPYSSLSLYRSAPVWKSFLNIKSIKGDVNGDDHVNVSDVAELINQILGIGPMDTDLADVNGDGRVNVSDVAALINIILGLG